MKNFSDRDYWAAVLACTFVLSATVVGLTDSGFRDGLLEWRREHPDIWALVRWVEGIGSTCAVASSWRRHASWRRAIVAWYLGWLVFVWDKLWTLYEEGW